MFSSEQFEFHPTGSQQVNEEEEEDEEVTGYLSVPRRGGAVEPEGRGVGGRRRSSEGLSV